MQKPIHLKLKIAVILACLFIVVIAWFSFWVFGRPNLTFTEFIAQIFYSDSPVYWQWSRILGISSYLLLWLSVMTGLSIGSQTSSFWFERGTALSWHQFFTWLGLGMGLLHAGILLKDSYLQPSMKELLMPFYLMSPQLGSWAWVWIGLGQIAFYGLGIIAIGSVFKQKIAKSIWRYLHAFGLLAYVSVVAHSVFIGTDSKQLWLQVIYLSTNTLLITVIMLRVMQLQFPVIKAKTN